LGIFPAARLFCKYAKIRQFKPALQQMATPEAGSMEAFINELQVKLDTKME